MNEKLKNLTYRAARFAPAKNHRQLIMTHIGDSSSLVAKFAIRRDAHLLNARLAEVKLVEF